MDDIVRQAMAKWPNVPHCYHWLALDARGSWRMRDERAQALGLAGDRIANPALIAFINRNYSADERGCQYFQNGPQRVYVDLDATPYIAHTDGHGAFVLHTGATVNALEGAWMTPEGIVILKGDGGEIAQVDDRDMAAVAAMLHLDGKAAGDEAVLAWMSGGSPGTMTLSYQGRYVPVERMDGNDIAARFGFIAKPTP